MAQILPASLGPRSLDVTRVGAGAMENVCRWYGDFLHAVCPVIWSQRCIPRVQRQSRLSTALKRPDLAEHRATNAIRCRVVVGGQPSGNGGEDLRRLGAVVLRLAGSEKPCTSVSATSCIPVSRSTRPIASGAAQRNRPGASGGVAGSPTWALITANSAMSGAPQNRTMDHLLTIGIRSAS